MTGGTPKHAGLSHAFDIATRVKGKETPTHLNPLCATHYRGDNLKGVFSGRAQIRG